jgi:hypothetical protein
VTLVFGIGLLVAFGWLNAGREPKLTLKFLSITNLSGGYTAQFAVTNVGDAVALDYACGDIEIFGQPSSSPVGCRATVHRLNPGEGATINVVFATKMNARWRFNSHFGRAGLRSWIYDWQWGTNGPGPRANRFIPKSLKGVQLTVNGTSDWIEP